MKHSVRKMSYFCVYLSGDEKLWNVKTYRAFKETIFRIQREYNRSLIKWFIKRKLHKLHNWKLKYENKIHHFYNTRTTCTYKRTVLLNPIEKITDKRIKKVIELLFRQFSSFTHELHISIISKMPFTFSGC